jgi:hypothetical protein
MSPSNNTTTISLRSGATAVASPSVNPTDTDIKTAQETPSRLEKIDASLAAAMKENNATEIAWWTMRKIQELHSMYPETDPDSFESRYFNLDELPENSDAGSTK